MSLVSVEFTEINFNSTDWYKAVELRENVLRKPLGSRFTEAELEEEQEHIHVAGFLDNELVATAVLVPEGTSMKMQRVAVQENLRGQRIGSQMMTFWPYQMWAHSKFQTQTKKVQTAL